VRVAEPPVPALEQHHLLPVLGEVGQHHLFVLVQDLRAHGHGDDTVRACCPCAAPAHAVAPGLGAEVLLVPEVYQGVYVRARAENDRAPAPAVAAVRPPPWDELLPPEGHGPRPAVAALEVNLGLVQKLHEGQCAPRRAAESRPPLWGHTARA
jgi:hypothetical protein